MKDNADQFIIVGRVSGVFGVRGWIKIYSYTEPRDHILTYFPWYVHVAGNCTPIEVLDGNSHGKGVIAHVKSYDDRDAAQRLINADIAIRRDQLPSIGQGEYYWADLVGLRVITLLNVELGTVSDIFETGANDVLVVNGDRERLIPYIYGEVVREIDLENKVMKVDWDPEF